MITAFWILSFLVAALAGAYGDLVLNNSNNLWTGRAILEQPLAILVAIQFTGWYPKVVQANAPGRKLAVPPLSELLLGATALLDPRRGPRPRAGSLLDPRRNRPDRDRRLRIAHPGVETAKP